MGNLQLRGRYPKRVQGAEDSRVRVTRSEVYRLPSALNLETKILLAGDLDLVEKGDLGTTKKDISEIERMLKTLIKSLKNKPLNPCILEPSSPIKLEKNRNC